MIDPSCAEIEGEGGFQEWEGGFRGRRFIKGLIGGLSLEGRF